MTSSSSTNTEVKRGSRLCKVNPKYFSLHWKSLDSGESVPDNLTKSKSHEFTSDNATEDKKANSFFKNIRKKLSIKNFYKSKRKSITIETSPISEEGTSNNKRSSTNDERLEIRDIDNPAKIETRTSVRSEESLNPSQINRNTNITQNTVNQSSLDANLNVNNSEDNLDPEKRIQLNENDGREGQSTLSQELLKLSKYGWYWGPMSGDQADALLLSEPDGAFLIRDSSSDRHLLTLSFKSAGKLLHARVEHSGGMFSLCDQGECGRFSSVPALVNHSMNFSKYSVFCYSRPRYPGHPAFPVRLTKPVSRFNQVRSLQYLCRFVIRQNTRRDNIHKLPLPKPIKGYVEEDYY
ncbi:cytokine-inducible SH2-containing protein-like [Chelonus insularis]|uniref:cytokine-inducible SH2-containing protein-like n=1 Tax=Chelonus insularis TaxID=460826 RepID=UPI00158BAB53|nr:cytokine-inducible SH2-containing protein-like [Chelonus insularis]